MLEILILYYIFSILFMFGNSNPDTYKVLDIILYIILILITAPIAFPIILGYKCSD